MADASENLSSIFSEFTRSIEEAQKLVDQVIAEGRSNTEKLISVIREESLQTRLILEQHDVRITRLENNQANRQ